MPILIFPNPLFDSRLFQPSFNLRPSQRRAQIAPACGKRLLNCATATKGVKFNETNMSLDVWTVEVKLIQFISFLKKPPSLGAIIINIMALTARWLHDPLVQAARFFNPYPNELIQPL